MSIDLIEHTLMSKIQIHIAFDRESGKSKGYGFAEYKSSELAHEARERLDGTIFQGRLVHILPASDRRDSKLDEFAISQQPLKKQKQIMQKAVSTSSFNWNSLYMNVRRPEMLLF